MNQLAKSIWKSRTAIKKFTSNKNEKKDGASHTSSLIKKVSNWCFFKNDYSLYINDECLGCKFCYVRGNSNPKPRLHLSQGIPQDFIHRNIGPFVLISRFYEPFLNEFSTANAIDAARQIIESGRRVIFRSALNDFPYKDEFINFISGTKVDYQFRVFASGSKYGRIINEKFCDKFDVSSDLFKSNQIYTDLGTSTSVIVDPFIIGVNESEVFKIINDMVEFGLTKLIIKQLFATPKFKAELTSIVAYNGQILSEKVESFYTYKNDMLLQHLLPIMEYADNKGIKVTLCGNRILNSLLLEDGENCCQVATDLILDPNRKSEPSRKKVKE